MSTNAPAIAIINEDDFDTFATYEPVMLTTAQLRPGMILIDPDGIACLELMHRIGSTGHGCIEWAAQDVDSIRTERASFAVSKRPNVRVANVRFDA
jgi:hypothetical protein